VYFNCRDAVVTRYESIYVLFMLTSINIKYLNNQLRLTKKINISIYFEGF